MIDSYQGLPAGVGVSYLEVYESESPDGIRGGSAHVHLSCTESYVVIGGSGRLQTLSRQGFEEIELHERQVVWFTPGVVHRLVSNGDLDIIIVMQNGGLPESGDCILSFPEEYLKDRARYRAAVQLPPIENGRDRVDAAAKARKDLSITGFVALRAAVERDGFRRSKPSTATLRHSSRATAAAGESCGSRAPSRRPRQREASSTRSMAAT